MSSLATLKAATSLGDVARLLEFKPAAVSYILYKQAPDTKYRTFQIPKRNGGERTIKAPDESLKLLQRRLSDLLQDCVDEINAAQQRKDRAAQGFKRGRSIITNARQHRHRRWVFNLDLEDFFPSINFGRVRGFFLKNRDFALHEKVATVIAQIACDDKALPQGSPCSPVISNLIAQVLDIRLVKLAKATGCTYSRYADDLTFSTNKRDFPIDIATPSATDGVGLHEWLPGKPLEKAIDRAGFRINAGKTHMQYRFSRQAVTGLLVNEKINVARDYHHNVRAMVNSLVTTGVFERIGVTQRDGQSVVEKRPGTLNELHGMLGFVDSIDVYNRTQTSDEPSDEMSSKEKAYRKFLFYSIFYATEIPVVICEGDTDNVYLTHAIRNLAREFPTLAEILPDGRIRLKVRLFKYPQTSTARLLELNDGGSGVLSKFMHAYKKETRRFTAPGLTKSVVIVYDNDAGANSIQNAIRSITGVKPTGDEPFVHVFSNLYAVPTPREPGVASSKIEDFFDLKIKETVVSGKTFNDGNGFDAAKHYGKKVFAHNVVRPNADTLDFGGFRQLLTNLSAAIEQHRS